MVFREELGPKERPLRGRFVLVIKDAEISLPIYKGRFVVKGFEDPRAKVLLHITTSVRSTNLRQEALRNIFALSSIRNR